MADDGKPVQQVLLPSPEGAEEQPAGPRGRGRPKGSGNKRTDGTVDAIGRMFGLPLEVLGQMWAEPARKKARRLRISMAEAEQERRQAATAGLPYMHQKLPLAIKSEGGRTTLVFNMGDGSAPPKQDQQNQPLIDGVAIRLDGMDLDVTDVLAENGDKDQ
ncbi:hypothetical protein [Ferrovibrio terrae]|uniref:hypothetical protein n=1 Tax=Ferrovibrio terrae TaxID=2594003 RepID=UPI003137BD28